MSEPTDKYVTEFGDALSHAVLTVTDTDDFKDARRGLLDAIFDEVQYAVIDRMPEILEGLVRDMAERTVAAILAGDESLVRRYLKLDGYTGRSGQSIFGHDRTPEQTHCVIHGKLHEGETLRIRREIVDAYPELLKSERIKDLEDQLAAMVAHNVKITHELERLRERVYHP